MRTEAEKWCREGQVRFPGAYRSVECRLSLYSLPGLKPDMAAVWKTYDEFVKASPADAQEFDKLRGKLWVGLAYLRAGQPDSAKALAAANQGDANIDPTGDLTNLASIIYEQAGDRDKALELSAKWLAMNPQQRAFAAQDKSWWVENLRKDPRYQALVR
jgi:tetratricopeptide (TPR) repeat protein